MRHFPRIQVRLRINKKESNGGTIFTVNIRLEDANTQRKTARAFTPRYPKVKDEAWWLVLCNGSANELYALKRVSFSGRLQTHMDLPSTLTNFQGIKLILVSDSYIGFEQEHSIERLA
ncbi:unnamed protein product [Withania somnifera]